MKLTQIKFSRLVLLVFAFTGAVLAAVPAHAATYQVAKAPCKGYVRSGASWQPAEIPFESGQTIEGKAVASRSDIVYWKDGETMYTVPLKCLAVGGDAEAGLPAPKKVTSARRGSQGYGDAGCGLGAMVIGNKPGIVQVVAATLNNIISYNQTWGISFGTLNCGAGGAAPTAQAYIDANRSSLANDMARGKGESLTGLIRMLGCKDEHAAGAALQKDHARIFPDNRVNSAQIEESIKNSLHGVCG